MRAILLTCSLVLLLTCCSYLLYEFITFRKTMLRELSILAKVISTNSTAALAFQSKDEAYEILASLKAEPHIVQACLYDKSGKLFTYYPEGLSKVDFPKRPQAENYDYNSAFLIGFQPIMQEGKFLGTLYIKSDMLAVYQRLQLYVGLGILIVIISMFMAYLLSRRLQKGITKPILGLVETARAISDRQDYSVRATHYGDDEIGLLTDAFNSMLNEIQLQNEQIQRFNQRLEQKIKERTRQLEMANKELESFSYSVSHDLRAPLRSIDGYSKILEEDYGNSLDDEGKKVLSTIVRNATKMGLLIEDLLEFSRLGKQGITKSALNIRHIVDELVEDMMGEVPVKTKIEIGELTEVIADESMIRQVFANLISNAIKYSRKKKQPLIEIGSFEENDELIYYVKDNGAGFDMDYYDKLFGVFQRLHADKEFEGTGVGLALVQRIISKHEGRVWAVGEENKGATFYFSLPKEEVVNPLQV